jgi:hypothetical protein
MVSSLGVCGDVPPVRGEDAAVVGAVVKPSDAARGASDRFK